MTNELEPLPHSSVELAPDRLHLVFSELANFALQYLDAQLHMFEIGCTIEWHDPFLNAKLIKDLLWSE